MNGALPPSSRPTRLIPEAHFSYNNRPTSVDPVNDIPATNGLLQSKSPTEGAFERLQVTTLKTPFGKPASSANFAKAKQVSGVSSAGLITTVQPTIQLHQQQLIDWNSFIYLQPEQLQLF